MHQSATDIASFTTGRASVLIGPRGAFGAQKQQLFLRDATRIRAEINRLFMLDSNRMKLRPYVARWGLDMSILTRSDRSHFEDWLTRKAAAGVIGIIVVPEPVVAFAGLVDKQESTVATLRGSEALNASQEPGTMLPAGLDDRFLILLSMVPDHMEGAVKRKFNDMIDAIGIEMIAVGLLMWIGAHFVPGLNLVVLAFDMFALSGEVMRAIDAVAKSIDDVQTARVRSDLTPIAKILAAALAVLIVNGVLNRFLKAKKVTRGQSKSVSGRGKKRTRSSSGSSSAPPRKRAKKSKPAAETNASSGGSSKKSGGKSASSKPKKKKKKSKRLQYVGRTPGKKSRTGREVQERMRAEKKLRGKGDNAKFKSSTDDKWYPVKEADMAHKTDAVKYWNETGKNHGAKSPEVRKWMLDSKNYELEHYSHNRSQGASLPDRYDPPAN